MTNLIRNENARRRATGAAVSATALVLLANAAIAGAAAGDAPPHLAPVEDLSRPARADAPTAPENPPAAKPAVTRSAPATTVKPPSVDAGPSQAKKTPAAQKPQAAASISGKPDAAATGVLAADNAALPPMGKAAVLPRPAFDSINAAPFPQKVVSGKFSDSVLRAQILLDRAHFSTGEIEGAYGGNMAVALAGYQKALGMKVTGLLDRATWDRLTLADPKPVIEAYTIDARDVSGPFVKAVPRRIAGQAALPCGCYASPLEELGEKFHVSPALLRRLNRGRALKPGTVIFAPMARVAAPTERAARVVVTGHLKSVAVLDAANRVIAQYPATIGSRHDPLPAGQWKIQGVARHPRYHYDPVHFWDANKKDAKATVQAGPNNPVGLVWTQLSIPHYGIHGTPEPGRIGKTFSHGCIRLTNWDALEFSRLVRPGTPVTLRN